MKTTAFILSILLSTTALAENYADQYGNIDMVQLKYAIENGEVPVVEGVDEAVEAIQEKFDRGDITEDQKNRLIHSIYSIEAANNDGPISGLSELSQRKGTKWEYANAYKLQHYELTERGLLVDMVSWKDANAYRSSYRQNRGLTGKGLLMDMATVVVAATIIATPLGSAAPTIFMGTLALVIVGGAVLAVSITTGIAKLVKEYLF